MKMYIFRHLTWWCLEIRDEFEGLAFPAFVDDVTVVARQADAVGHVFVLPREEKLPWTQPPVISLEREVFVVPLRWFGAVASFLLPQTHNGFILDVRLSLGCSFVKLCTEHHVADRELLARTGVFEDHAQHVRQVFGAEATLRPSRHVRVLGVLDTVVQAFLSEDILPYF